MLPFMSLGFEALGFVEAVDRQTAMLETLGTQVLVLKAELHEHRRKEANKGVLLRLLMKRCSQLEEQIQALRLREHDVDPAAAMDARKSDDDDGVVVEAVAKSRAAVKAKATTTRPRLGKSKLQLMHVDPGAVVNNVDLDLGLADDDKERENKGASLSNVTVKGSPLFSRLKCARSLVNSGELIKSTTSQTSSLLYPASSSQETLKDGTSGLSLDLCSQSGCDTSLEDLIRDVAMHEEGEESFDFDHHQLTDSDTEHGHHGSSRPASAFGAFMQNLF